MAKSCGGKISVAVIGLAFVVALSMVPGLALAVEQQEPSGGVGLQAAEAGDSTGLEAQGEIASGTWGTCPWTIDSDGVLTVSAGKGANTDSRGIRSPWASYKKSIKKVVFEDGMKAPACIRGLLALGWYDSSTRKYESILEEADLSGLDTSNVTDMSAMFFYCTSLTSLDVSNFDTSKVVYMHDMFYDCSSLTSLDVSNFDTSNVTATSSMFSGCSSLTSLDVSNFDTSNVKSMSGMFAGCSSLTSLDVKNFDTSKVKRMSRMFAGYSSPTSLDVSNFDTSNVYSMEGMFARCSSLTSLDVSNFDTSSVTDMSNMFQGCSSLTSVDLSSFDMSKVDNFSFVFNDCTSLVSVDLSGLHMQSEYLTMSDLFSGCTSLTSVDFSGVEIPFDDSAARMFKGCSSLTAVDLSGIEGKGMDDMESMFEDCSSLRAVDISGFDTSSVLSMASMFSGCSSLSSVDLPRFGTARVRDMTHMFSGCSSLASLDLSSFDTTNLELANFMFSGCSSLVSLDLSAFDTSNLEGMWYMFKDCSSLVSLDLSFLDVSQQNGMTGMFSGCSSLRSLDLSSFDTGNFKYMSELFSGCSALETIYVGDGWSTEAVVSSGDMFLGCERLVGSNGTAYNPACVSHTYACVDAESTPGYFTYKELPARRDFSSATVTLSQTSYTYDGGCKKPGVEVSLDGVQLVSGVDYYISYRNNVNAGTATVMVRGAGKSGYQGCASASFTIEKAESPISLFEESKVYNGGASKYSGNCVVRGKRLYGLPNDCWERYYFDAQCTQDVGREVVIEPGTYYVKAFLEETENYKSAVSEPIKFTVEKGESSISLKNQTKTYTGGTLAYTGTVTTEGSKGSVSYAYYSDAECKNQVAASNVKNAGTYYVKGTVSTDTYYKAATSDAVRFTVKKGVSSITLKSQSKTYNGRVLKYTGAVTKKGSKGAVTLKYYSDAKCKKQVKPSNVKNAGTYYVKATVAADSNCKSATSAAVKFTVNKAVNPMKVRTTAKTVSLAKVKKSAQTVAPFILTKPQGTKVFVVTAGSQAKAKKYLKLNKSTGKVTVKKGTPKGAYVLKVKVTSKGNKNYKASAAKTVSVKVIVK